MWSNSSPYSATSSNMGGSGIRYFAFFTRWTLGAPLNLGFTYAGVEVTSTSFCDSIVGQSSLCRRDYLMEVVVENLTVFGGVLIITAIPPCLNL